MRYPQWILLTATLVLPACSTMRTVESPVVFLEQNNPRHVRVYDNAGDLYVLRDPQLRGDTIRGFEPLEQEEMSLSLRGIQRMEALQPDKKRTTLFIGAMTLLAGAGIYMITEVAGGGGKLYCDNYDVANRCVTQPPANVSIPLRLFR